MYSLCLAIVIVVSSCLHRQPHCLSDRQAKRQSQMPRNTNTKINKTECKLLRASSNEIKLMEFTITSGQRAIQTVSQPAVPRPLPTTTVQMQTPMFCGRPQSDGTDPCSHALACLLDVLAHGMGQQRQPSRQLPGHHFIDAGKH